MATLIRPGTPSRLPPPGRDAGNCHLPDGVRLPGQDPKRGALSGHKEFQGLQRGVAFYFSFFQQAVLSNLKILSSLPSFRIRSSDAILSSLFTLILVKSPLCKLILLG